MNLKRRRCLALPPSASLHWPDSASSGMRVQTVVAHLDYIATGVEAGFIPPDSVPLMLADIYGTAEGVGE